ncbi:MAG TPA: cupin domain-containing protein [Thermoanaerobaculia bacterium]|jgi:quercetin dioxygenase-like cupin family protein|nr:cupin domain-containing protein [Thermoanaerobaculia bacterium]
MRTLILASLLAFTVNLGAQTPETPIGFIPEAIAFKDAPPTLPPGSKVSVLEGNPGAEGMFTMRVRIPAGSAIPPHWHPRQERVTVLAGAVDLGFGAVANKNSVTRYRAGSFYLNPPRMVHFLYFPENTELQITGVGPWELMTTDPNAKPAAAEGATVKVREITPAPGSELTPTATIKATIDYNIQNFRPDTYFLDFVFESRVPNRTIGIAPTVVPYRKGATQSHFVESATGTITLIQDLGRFLDLPDLKHPIRMRVYVHEKRSETSNHVVGMSDWIEFK